LAVEYWTGARRFGPLAPLIATLLACTPIQQPDPKPVPKSTSASTAPSNTEVIHATPSATQVAALSTEFDAFAAGLDAQVGMAIAPLGGGPLLTLGSWQRGPAWSTAKVPLVIAALREQPTGEPTDQMRAAITSSDNDAAQAIWESLGNSESARAKVEAVLRGAGDPTVVQSIRIRPEYSAFGQSLWSIADQASFLAHAACDPSNDPVLELMSEIEPQQRWGLGEITDSRFKGGWGPAPDGTYLVRQFGLVPTQHGQIAVALAGVANSGGFGAGTSTLDELTGWLSTHLNALQAGSCPPQ